MPARVLRLRVLVTLRVLDRDRVSEGESEGERDAEGDSEELDVVDSSSEGPHVGVTLAVSTAVCVADSTASVGSGDGVWEDETLGDPVLEAVVEGVGVPLGDGDGDGA